MKLSNDFSTYLKKQCIFLFGQVQDKREGKILNLTRKKDKEKFNGKSLVSKLFELGATARRHSPKLTKIEKFEKHMNYTITIYGLLNTRFQNKTVVAKDFETL